MKVNYVLMYGIPYVRYKEFETFEDISKFLVHKGYVNYSIFKKLEDKEEIEMIYRDNDIHYLENFVKEQDKEIERLKELSKVDSQQAQEIIIELKQEIERLKDLVKQLWNNNKSSNLNEEQKELLNSTIFGSDKE